MNCNLLVGILMVYAMLCHTGTCLSFSHEDKNLFVVGAENGSVFKCSMQSMETGNIDQITGTRRVECM